MDSVSTIIINRKYLLINSNSQTINGSWISGPPYNKLPLDVTKDILINEVTNALNLSKKNVPHPKDWKVVNQEFLKKINEKSLNSIYKDAKNVLILRDKHEITFLPTKNVGGKGRFDHLTEFEVKIPVEASNEEIYNTLMKAFSSCD